MQRAGDVLGGAMRRMKRPEATLAWLVGSWPKIVGKTLAAHTRPLQCQAGQLRIAADGKGWKSQLEEMSNEFCARINQAWGGKLIREVKFVPAPRSAAGKPGPKRIPREADNEYLPFIRSRKK
jgi:predicted nucleic acid-binding Zn ribbon protein